jgi:hypothetical protein
MVSMGKKRRSTEVPAVPPAYVVRNWDTSPGENREDILTMRDWIKLGPCCSMFPGFRDGSDSGRPWLHTLSGGEGKKFTSRVPKSTRYPSRAKQRSRAFRVVSESVVPKPFVLLSHRRALVLRWTVCSRRPLYPLLFSSVGGAF